MRVKSIPKLTVIRRNVLNFDGLEAGKLKWIVTSKLAKGAG